MSGSLGRLVASLAEPVESVPPELIELINQRIRPPEMVSAANVYVRAMYVVSDEVNSFGGCFPPDEHQRLAELMVDSPVMVGHRKDKLPVGRTFHATTVEREGRPWVKSYFYWLRSASDADQLRDNIDGGVYRECSVAFTFSYPECALCGRDIRTCEHQPMQSYRHGGVERLCHFNYRRLERVLETSLVYRGAVPRTSITRELNSPDTELRPLEDSSELDPGRRYLVTPRYDGLSVVARSEGDGLVMERLDGMAASVGDVVTTWRPRTPVRGVLVAYRGKERCSRAQLEAYLSGREAPATRLLLNVYPDGSPAPRCDRGRSSFEVRPIPHRVTAPDRLDACCREIMTSLGVEVRPLEGDTLVLSDEPGFRYVPRQGRADHVTRLRIYPGNPSTLSLADRTGERIFTIDGFDANRLSNGRRFLARPAAQSVLSAVGKRLNPLVAELTVLSVSDRMNEFGVRGDLNGTFRLRPVRHRGQAVYLFYRNPDGKNAGSMVNAQETGEVDAGTTDTRKDTSRTNDHE